VVGWKSSLLGNSVTLKKVKKKKIFHIFDVFRDISNGIRPCIQNYYDFSGGMGNENLISHVSEIDDGFTLYKIIPWCRYDLYVTSFQPLTYRVHQKSWLLKVEKHCKRKLCISESHGNKSIIIKLPILKTKYFGERCGHSPV
jgi:hypothetical protein